MDGLRGKGLKVVGQQPMKKVLRLENLDLVWLDGINIGCGINTMIVGVVLVV